MSKVFVPEMALCQREDDMLINYYPVHRYINASSGLIGEKKPLSFSRPRTQKSYGQCAYQASYLVLSQSFPPSRWTPSTVYWSLVRISFTSSCFLNSSPFSTCPSQTATVLSVGSSRAFSFASPEENLSLEFLASFVIPIALKLTVL